MYKVGVQVKAMEEALSLVVLSGSIETEEDAGLVEEQLEMLATNRHIKVAVDLSKLRDVSDYGVSAILAGKYEIIKSGGHVVFFGLNDTNKGSAWFTLFSTVRLEIFGDLEAATLELSRLIEDANFRRKN